MNERVVSYAATALLIVWGAGCSSGGGLFQPPKSSGLVVATQVGGSTMATSAGSPLLVNGGFSVALSEGNYSATFTATIVSYTAPTVGPCYTVTMDSTGTIATFTPRAAPPVSGAVTAPSPCLQLGTDVESVLFQDQKKHTNQEYFENVATTGGAGPIIARITGTSPVLVTSAAQPLLVNNGFQLTVSEANYVGPFTASIASFTAPLTGPCYSVSMDATGTIATLAPHATSGLSGSTSPCTIPNDDIESVLFADGHGGRAQVFFENQVSAVLGTIQARLSASGATLATTLTQPAAVSGGFSVFLSESAYSGPFAATIISFTAASASSCYTVAMDSTQTVAIFTPRSAPTPTGPCGHGSDTEGVLFTDLHGNYVEQFFVN
jgi:hypothetical protein